jgi:hypothetical protein
LKLQFWQTRKFAKNCQVAIGLIRPNEPIKSDTQNSSSRV